jgi:hypothetical protein
MIQMPCRVTCKGLGDNLHLCTVQTRRRLLLQLNVEYLVAEADHIYYFPITFRCFAGEF